MEAIKLDNSFRPVHGLQDLHSTGEFENAQGEHCSISLELDATSAMDHEYNVRTFKRYLTRNGGTTVVHTENSVETFYSMKNATRGYNWALYLLNATEVQTAQFKL